jgi:hypothetical protein
VRAIDYKFRLCEARRGGPKTRLFSTENCLHVQVCDSSLIRASVYSCDDGPKISRTTWARAVGL